MLELYRCWCDLSFYVSAEDSNSSPQACAAITPLHWALPSSKSDFPTWTVLWEFFFFLTFSPDTCFSFYRWMKLFEDLYKETWWVLGPEPHSNNTEKNADAEGALALFSFGNWVQISTIWLYFRDNEHQLSYPSEGHGPRLSSINDELFSCMT